MRWPAVGRGRQRPLPGALGGDGGKDAVHRLGGHPDPTSWLLAGYGDAVLPSASDFDLSKWLTAHTALLNESRVTWERKGYSALTEGQNHFNLRGNSAVLAGKPDLVAHKGDEVKIIDAKTGRPSPADALQVMIYMYALPRALERYRGLKLTGQVAYSDHVVNIPAEAVDEAFVRNMGQLITRLASEMPARRISSPGVSAGSARSRQQTALSEQGKALRKKARPTTFREQQAKRS